MSASTPTSFEIAISNEVLHDLEERLSRTRFAPDFSNADWRYGVQREYLEQLIHHWLTRYDWREHEAAMNTFSHFRVSIDGFPIHFIHERGKGPRPMPLIVSHGWPWSFWDLRHVIGPLSDPASYGQDPADAFDVVVPSLPGHGFSVPVSKPGMNYWRTADLWQQLMRDVLGFSVYGAQGGDWGALIASQLGHKYSDFLVGVHITMALPLSVFQGFAGAGGSRSDDLALEHVPVDFPGADQYRQADIHRLRWMEQTGSMSTAASHIAVHSNDPQTLAHALHDSPAGLCAWLVQRRRHWSDCGGDVERRFSKDDLITLTMLYWVTEAAVSSFRYYWEGAHHRWRPERDRLPVVRAPTGVALFPKEPFQPPDQWLKRYYNLHRVTEMTAGGHFAPAEEPEQWVEDVRAFFRPLRP